MDSPGLDARRDGTVGVGPIGFIFTCKAFTDFHWQVRREKRDGTVLSIWNIYPTSKKILIDPNKMGLPIHIKKWSGLTMTDCINAAKDAYEDEA